MYLGLIGKYEGEIKKHKLSLPSKYIEVLGDTVVVAPGFDKGMFDIYPVPSWDKFANKLVQLPDSVQDCRLLKTYFFAGADELKVVNGIINISEHTLKLVNNTKDVIICGLGNKVSVWDVEKYEDPILDNINLERMCNDYGIRL